MTIQKGGQNCPITYFTYISINSCNDIWTDEFGNTDQKQSLWTSRVSKYTWPNINIKINVKRFSGRLDTRSNIAIISKHLYGPNLGLYREFLAKLQEFLKPKYKRFIKVSKYIHVRDQKASLQHYELMWYIHPLI